MLGRASNLVCLLTVVVGCGSSPPRPAPPTVVVRSESVVEPKQPQPTTPEQNEGMRLSVYEVDDASNPFAALAAKPPQQGVVLGIEHVPAPCYYATVRTSPGESMDSARRRLEGAIRTIVLPPGRFIGFQKSLDDGIPKGWRTYVLSGEPLLTDADLRAADLQFLNNPLDQFVISLEFSPKGAERLAILTDRFLDRRIAFVVDGVVLMAPVVMSRIDAGRTTIYLPGVPLSEVPSRFASGVRIDR